VGAKTRLPSGKTYRVAIFGRRTIDVEEEDVDVLLAFKGECCAGGRGKTPLFERDE